MTEYNQFRWKKSVPILVFLLLYTLSVFFAWKVYTDAEQVFPHSIVLRSDYGFMMEGDYENGDTLSRVSVSTGFAENRDRSSMEQVNLYYTDSAFDVRGNLHLIEGSYFAVLEGRERNCNVVISDTLAQQLFQSTEVLGKELTINGEPFTVVGIYKQDTSLFSRLAGNGHADIYLPYPTAPEGTPIQYLYASPSLTDFSASIVQAVYGLTGQYYFGAEIVNYPDYLRWMRLLCSLAGFLCGVSMAGVLWGITYPHTRAAIQSKDWKSAVKAGIFLLLGAGIFWLVLFTPDAPASILPPDNILDFKYYFEELVTAFQQLHTGVYDPTQAQALLCVAANAGWFFAAVVWLIAAGISALMWRRACRKWEE